MKGKIVMRTGNPSAVMWDYILEHFDNKDNDKDEEDEQCDS